MDDTRWDHGLTVTGEGSGLVGDAGAVLLRKLAGPYGQADLKDTEPDTLRYRLLSLPARLACHARARMLKISRTWPWKEAFLTCWQRLCALPPTRLTSHPRPCDPERRPPGAIGTGATPSTSGHHRHPPATYHCRKPGTTQSVTYLADTLNHRG